MESNNPAMEIASYPVKFSDDITVDINAEAEEHCIIVMTNQQGVVLRMMGVNLTKGKNQIHLEKLNILDAGTYQLSVKNKSSNILYSSTLTKF